MQVEWTIKGEGGKPFNATIRSLETAEIESAVINFRSLDADTLTFTISPELITTAIIPGLEQEMTLYRDGVQFFTGTVTSVRPVITSSSQQVQVVVSGPWWWLDRVNMTQQRTAGAGSARDRMTFVLGTAAAGGNLRSHIIAVMDRAIALGVPVAKGTFDSYFTVPQISLNQTTCGQALAELIRLVPDSMVYFDYSVTPPTINVKRRSGATTRTINVSAAAVEEIDISPITELQVSQVRLPYVERDTQGRTRYQEQASGTSAVGKVEILTVSGPEIDTFLPNDLFDSYSIKTVAPASAGNFVQNQDGSLKELAKKSGYSNGRLPLVLSPYPSYSLWVSQSSSSIPPAHTYQNTISVAPLTLTAINGTAYSTSTRKIITTTDPPEWVKKELGINVREAVFEGYLAVDHYYYLEYGGKSTPLPSWWESVGFELQLSGFTSPTSSGSRVRLGFKKFAVRCFVTTSDYPTATTVYRPADYTFIEPPEGLAANLLAAQNWLPYEGSIRLVDEDVGGTRYRGTKIRLTNTLSQYATMDALVASETIDIGSGTTTIELGQPPRIDYRTFVDRIRKTSQDNIVYL